MSIVAIDGQAVGARTNLDERLANTIDRRVVLTVSRAADGRTRDVTVRPDEPGGGEGAALSRVGGRQPRVRAEGERRAARATCT